MIGAVLTGVLIVFVAIVMANHGTIAAEGGGDPPPTPTPTIVSPTPTSPAPDVTPVASPPSTAAVWTYTGTSMSFAPSVSVAEASEQFTYEGRVQRVRVVTTYSGGIAALGGPESGLVMNLGSVLTPADIEGLELRVNGGDGYKFADAIVAAGSSTTKLT